MGRRSRPLPCGRCFQTAKKQAISRFEAKMVEEELNPRPETIHDGFFDVWFDWDKVYDL